MSAEGMEAHLTRRPNVERILPGARSTGSTLATIAGALAYAGTLHWVFTTKVSPLFGYLGYTSREPVWQFYLVTLLMAILVALALPSRISRTSDFMLWLLFLMVIAPSMFVAQYSRIVSPGVGLTTSLAIGAAALLTIAIARSVRFRALPRINLSPTSFWLLIGAFSAVVYGYLTLTVGLQIRLVGILDVYDLRDEYRSQLAAVGGPLAYLVAWQGNVVNPAIVVWGVFRRRWAPVILGSFGQLLLFSATGFKTFMLSIPAVLVIQFLFRSRFTSNGSLYAWAAAAFSLCCVALDQVMNSITLTSLFVRRFLLTPGMLTAAYVRFFSENPKLYLSHSIAHGWMTYPYDVPYTKAVGEYMTGRRGVSMNANVYADGFANAGWWGVGISAVLLGLLLALLDSASKGLPLAVCAGMVLMPSITLSNSALFTSIWSHGVGLVIVMLAVAPRSGWPRRPDPGSADGSSGGS